MQSTAAGRESQRGVAGRPPCWIFQSGTHLRPPENDHAQHNELRVSFVGQVDWNTEPASFFFGHFVFFFARPRRFGEKKVTRNIEKKAHGLS